MRVTQSGLWGLIRENLASTSTRLREAEEQAASGLLINRPSDAPEMVGQIDRLQGGVLDQKVYGANATQAQSTLDQMDSQLGRMHDTLTRAREIAIQSSGDVPTAGDRTISAVEVASLLESMLATANSEFAGSYLFAGTAYDSPPYDAVGTYSGSTDTPSVRVGDETWVTSGLDGSAVFDDTVNVFSSIAAFQLALESDDSAGILTAIDDIDAAMTQVIAARTAVGADTNVAMDAGTLAESVAVQFGERLGAIVNVDPAEAYMRVAELRNSYQAALQVAASARTGGLFALL